MTPKMVLNPEELSLNIKPTYVPRTISEFLGEVFTIRNVSDKVLKLDGFIERLEDEMRKIDAFKRELPLSVVLINDAIVALKEELIQCKKTNVEPVLEEFMPLKKSCDEAEDDEVKKEKESRDKKNWMSSVQLWNNLDNRKTEFSYNKNQNSLVEINKENVAMPPNLYTSCKTRTEGRTIIPPLGGFSAFPVLTAKEEDKKEPTVAKLSLLTPGTSNPSEGLGSGVLCSKSSSSKAAVSSSSPNHKTNLRTIHPPLQQTSRKPRRCWSQELHRRFVGALQQLGGPQAATPKQIRELMQVDGLTNDEVKSHLQKYRLHHRRVPATTTTTTATTPTNKPSLALGGLWMPQDQHGKSSKHNHSQSGSPEGPLQLVEATGGTYTTGGDSMEDEEDERSESYSWRTRIHNSGKDDV